MLYNLGGRVVLPPLSEYREHIYHWILSSESCPLLTATFSFLRVRWQRRSFGVIAEGGNHSSRCSDLWTIAQIPSLNVEMTAVGMVAPSALLDTVSAAPELEEGSRTGPWLLCSVRALTGSSSSCLYSQAKSRTRALGFWPILLFPPASS